MTWREPKNHSDGCYFRSCHVRVYNGNNQKIISYPDNIPSVIRPVSHGPDVPVPLPPTELPVISSESSDSEHSEVQGSNTEYRPKPSARDDLPQPFSQVELNDRTRDLGLSKEAAELLGSRLKKNLHIGQRNLFLLAQESRKGIC